jgi:hypothetical protein
MTDYAAQARELARHGGSSLPGLTRAATPTRPTAPAKPEGWHKFSPWEKRTHQLQEQTRAREADRASQPKPEYPSNWGIFSAAERRAWMLMWQEENSK